MSGNRAARRAGARPAGPPPGRYGSGRQHRSLAPAVLGALVLVVGALAIRSDVHLYVRFAACALALITAVFVGQSKHWGWLPVPLVVAVLWNPAVPFAFDGQPYRVGHVVAGIALLVCGASTPYVERRP